MERVSIFIDAGNLYHLVLKKLELHEKDFDFEKFAQFLVGDREVAPEGKRFYIATVREQLNGHESRQAMSHQTVLFSELQKHQLFRGF